VVQINSITVVYVSPSDTGLYFTTELFGSPYD